ncbi:MAG: NAD-dependent epimerase/dehydratase family protein [Aeriscardovia sp.]|nr:NAD-dependent epimerase/dehydratase family protein [Aeriscardovia sp.]
MFEYKNMVVQEDLKLMADEHLDWHQFDGKTILVTGATGMLATYISYFLLYLKEEKSIDLKLLALCRTKSKAETIFKEFLNKSYFGLLLQDVCEPIQYDGNIDYIFHLAGNASPHFINTDPVGIVKSNMLGTFNVLELAKEKQSSKVVFASTREVYGKNEKENSLTETSFGTIDPMENRSCYPESKRAAETIFRSYFLQYGINFNALRIAHSYGPGMNLHSDGRVMADFIGNIVDGKDIELKSTGEALRAFCYITDAITGIFYAALKGEPGEAYNLANETEEISIRDLAQMLVYLRRDKDLKVVFNIPETNTGYCKYKRVGLNTQKIESIGWQPMVSLKEGCLRTINSFVG